MIVEQAIYGDDGGAHGLLMSSGGRAAVAQLAGRTDLPGTAPPGVPWEPYVSGFPHGAYYVVARTFPDPHASRGGMVFAHALFLPLEEATLFLDLRAVTDVLLASPVRPQVLEPIELVPDPGRQSPGTTTESLLALAGALVARDVRAPVVWAGQQGFTEAIVALWARLWPEIRRTFTFRLSFGPQDCRDAPPVVICTPRLLESRWTGYRVVDPERSNGSDSEAARCLIGLPGGERLDSFQSELGARLTRLSDLSLLEQCRRYVADSAASADERLALVRLLARLSPAPGDGSELKRRALGVLAESVPGMDSPQVLALRNLELAAFPDEWILWNSLACWLGNAAARSVPGVEIVLIHAASGNGAVPAWKAAILAGFDQTAGEGGPGFAASLWRWFTERPELVHALAVRLPEAHAIEKSLADACPIKLGGAVAEAVLGFAAGRRWLRLYGAAAAAAFETGRAIEKQLSVDREAGSVDGLREVFRRAQAKDVLAAALRWDDARLVDLAAEACLAEPGLLAGMDARNLTWRAILAASIEREPSRWEALPDPMALLDQLLDLAAAREVLPPGLWSALAKTPLGDLTEHPRRSALWRVLPPDVTMPLLAATADGWLGRFATNPDFQPLPEQELRRELLDATRVEHFLNRSACGRASEGTELFLRFQELSESRFVSWLEAVASRTLPAPDATSLGRLVMRRRWRHAAHSLAELVSRGSPADLRPAVHESYALLSLWERIWLWRSGVWDIPQPTPEELWHLLEQEATELYPRGPEDQALWSRAGGKTSQLRHDGTGQERWSAALELLRHGGAGDMTPAWLLGTMRHDYGNNDRLSWLAAQPMFQDRHHD